MPKINNLLRDYYTMSKQELNEYFRDIVPEYTNGNEKYSRKASKKKSVKTGKAKAKII